MKYLDQFKESMIPRPPDIMLKWLRSLFPKLSRYCTWTSLGRIHQQLFIKWKINLYTQVSSFRLCFNMLLFQIRETNFSQISHITFNNRNYFKFGYICIEIFYMSVFFVWNPQQQLYDHKIQNKSYRQVDEMSVEAQHTLNVKACMLITLKISHSKF